MTNDDLNAIPMGIQQNAVFVLGGLPDDDLRRPEEALHMTLFLFESADDAQDALKGLNELPPFVDLYRFNSVVRPVQHVRLGDGQAPGPGYPLRVDAYSDTGFAMDTLRLAEVVRGLVEAGDWVNVPRKRIVRDRAETVFDDEYGNLEPVGAEGERRRAKPIHQQPVIGHYRTLENSNAMGLDPAGKRTERGRTFVKEHVRNLKGRPQDHPKFRVAPKEDEPGDEAA